MGLTRNLLTGWTNSVVSAVLGLIMVPVYLRFLGTEAYGLIAIFITLQSLVQVFDLGLAATMNRAVARGAALGQTGEAVRLAAALERVYALVAVAIALGLAGLSPLIAAHWLNARTLSIDYVSVVLVLIGIALAARWPIGLYQAVLLGANRAAAFSAINIAMSVTTALGVIAFLLWRADLRVVLAWQIGAALVLLGWLRHAAWQILGPRVAGPMDYSILRQQWKFSAAVAGINVIGLWFMQYDKLALSRLLPLALFSHYMIATLVVSTLYQLITPVFNVVYPRFTSLYARAEHEQLRQGYRLMTALVAAVVFPLAMWLMVWGEGLVRLWTGSADIAADVAPVVALLAAGSGLHAVMYVVYALQLGQGEEKLALKISLALLVVQAPLVWYLTVHWGGVGAAAAWLCLHIIYLLFGGWVTHRRLQPGLAWGWLCRDVGVPLLLCAAAGTIASLIQRAAGPQSWFAVLLGAGFAALLAFIGLLSSPSLRPRTLSLLSSLLRRWATP